MTSSATPGPAGCFGDAREGLFAVPDDLGAFGLRQALHVAEHGVGFVAVGQVQAEHADAGVLQGFQHWVAAIDGEHARQQAFFPRGTRRSRPGAQRIYWEEF